MEAAAPAEAPAGAPLPGGTSSSAGAVDALIQACLNPPTPSENAEAHERDKFAAMARAAVGERPAILLPLQRRLGWTPDNTIRVEQSVTPSMLQALGAELMSMPAAPPAGLDRTRSMPADVVLPNASNGSVPAPAPPALTLVPQPPMSHIAMMEGGSFVTAAEREKEADRLHKSQVAVRQCLSMPTEDQATKRRAQNIEAKLFVEAANQCESESDQPLSDEKKKQFYTNNLEAIYKKMDALVRSHKQDAGGVRPPAPAPLPAGQPGPFASLTSQGLTPQGSLGVMPTAPMAAAGSGPAAVGGAGGAFQPVAAPAPPRPAPRADLSKESQQYWQRLDKLRPHRNFAMRYISTLDKFTEKTLDAIAKSADEQQKLQLSKKRKVAENVRKYLWLLCRLCNDEQSKGSKMPPNLRLLDVIHKTLEAVYKRQRMPDAKKNNSGLAAQQRRGGLTAPARHSSRLDYTAGAALINPNPNPNALKFSYDVESLEWDSEHRRNRQDRYCYCGTNKQECCLQCTVCKNWFHKGCTSDVVPKDGEGWVEFQVNYRFTCKVCCSADNKERFELTKCSWLDSILGGFHNLMYYQNREMFKAAEITNHLDRHWDALCHQRERGDNKKWRNSLNSYLTNNMKKFDRPKKFYWAIANPTNDPTGPTVQPCRLFKDGNRNEAPSDTKPTKPKPKSKPKPPKPTTGSRGRGSGGAAAGGAAWGGSPVGQPPYGTGVGTSAPLGLEDQPWDGGAMGYPPQQDFFPGGSGMMSAGGFSDQDMTWDDPTSHPPLDQFDTSNMFAAAQDPFSPNLGLEGDGTPMGAPAEQEDICPLCNLGTRNFGSVSRNQYICVKCDQDEHDQPVPDLEKAKIPNNQFVWSASVTVGSDPVPYKVTICNKCHDGDVKNSGHLLWALKDREIPFRDFVQEQYMDPTEEWVECEFCNSWYHQVCILFDKQIYGEKLPPACPKESCRLAREMKYGNYEDVRHPSEDLPQSTLSQFLEEKLEREVFGGTHRAGNHGVTVRVISNVKRSVPMDDLASKIGGRYHTGEKKELPYMQKTLYAFYRCPDGAEIAFFALQVQEYGAECPAPNTNTAYISYLDANQLYHCPTCGAHNDVIGPDSWTNPQGSPSLCTTPEECKRERRRIYDTLFVGYMDYLKQRGMHRAYIWVMPPEGHESDYVFYYRPREMHIPTADQLEDWYIRLLKQAEETGAITHFEDNTGKQEGGKAAGSKKQKRAQRNTNFLFQPPTPVGGQRGKRLGDADEASAADEPAAKKAKTGQGAVAAADISLSHMPIFKGDHMAGVIEQVLNEKEKKETGARTTGNSARAQAEAESAASTTPGARGTSLGRTLSKSLVDQVTSYMTDQAQGSYILCHFEAEADESFTPTLLDDPPHSIDSDGQGARPLRAWPHSLSVACG